MFKRLFGLFGIGAVLGVQANPGIFYEPYEKPYLNVLYNMLFCDIPALHRDDSPEEDAALRRKMETENPALAKEVYADENSSDGPSVFDKIFADAPDSNTLSAIAANEREESRVRALAFNALRAGGHEVELKSILGAIYEMRVDGGLDVIAAYADGQVRYFNHAESVVMFEGAPKEVAEAAKDWIASAQDIAHRIGPAGEPRHPPPDGDRVRISLLVSDGLYVGEGPYDVLAEDPMGGAMIAKALAVFKAISETPMD
jgi:hypothetical protein